MTTDVNNNDDGGVMEKIKINKRYIAQRAKDEIIQSETKFLLQITRQKRADDSDKRRQPKSIFSSPPTAMRVVYSIANRFDIIYDAFQH